MLLPGAVMLLMMMEVKGDQNYGEALSKCILFFEGQRSGKLPPDQRMTWRKDSALKDGSDIGMDLEGGYYDAGDNVKFHYPMAFTTTMLAWSILEFGRHMKWEEGNAINALKWGTDYLLKATNDPTKVVVVVGDPYSDHDCWERPEDMDTARTSYVINSTHPGSEVSAEIAAALAASYMVFSDKDSTYANWLIDRAAQVFQFADQYRGSYNFSLGNIVCPFYCDGSGYMDDLIWGAVWLHKATNDNKYWNYIIENSKDLKLYDLFEWKDPGYLGGTFTEFGWDTKNAGINVLISRTLMGAQMAAPAPDLFVEYADKFICSLLPESPSKSVIYSPGGLLIKPGPSNAQRVTALSFLVLVYSRYMERAHNRTIDCGANVIVTSSRLLKWVKSQVDYLLGNNPLNMSYMVGYGKQFPTKYHHRGSTLPSIVQYPEKLKCRDGDKYFSSPNPNMNELTGAILGGPDANDKFNNSREVIEQTEPITYINAPFVGVLGYFKAFPNLD